MSRKCLAIGVGSVTPVGGGPEELPFLDGAVVAAETIGQWALHSGFAEADVLVLTDKGGKSVTDVSLQDAFDRLLPTGTQTEHLILSFAGHGLTGLNDDITYWLLSDSLDQGYQIFVEDMRRQLYSYGIQRLTIFSDACRAIANTRDLHGLSPRPGVRKRHQPPNALPLARYNACQDASSAFMVKVPNAAAPGKCIFSGVLAEALWGLVPDALDGTVVDSASLGRGLVKAVGARATQYNLTLVPGGNPFFDKVVYFDQNAPPLPPNPPFAPWPAPNAAQPISAGPVVRESGGLESAHANEPHPVPNVFKSVLDDTRIRGAILGDDFGAAHLDIDTSKPFPGLPPAAKPLVESVALARRRLASPGLAKEVRETISAEISGQLQTLEGLAAGEVRQKKADHVIASLRKVADLRPDPDASLFVVGKVKQVRAHTAVRALHHTPLLSQFAFTAPAAEGLMMLEFADGLFAPVWCYRNLVCTVLRDIEGVAAISYRAEWDRDAGAEGAAADAISLLATGKLSADIVDKLATRLRTQKHVNPAFGAIAAYCYDVTGDLNSIRRVAYYYGSAEQPVPYDVALLGMMESDGQWAQVPAVPQDDRRSPGDWPFWVTAKTEAQKVRIAGSCPWLRQGWDFVVAPEDVERPLVDGLAPFRAHLRSSPFTTLDAEGGRMLAAKWGLRPVVSLDDHAGD
jgi:hypothetical protein